MKVSVFSLLMSVMFSTAFIMAVHALRNRAFFLRSFGAHTLLIMYGFCVLRMVFPMEMPITVPVGLRGGYYNKLYAGARDAVVPLGGGRAELPDVLCAVWAAVAAALLLRFILAEWSVHRDLNRCRVSGGAAAQECLERVMAASDRKPSASVCVCTGVDEPISIGILRKRIYIPDKEYGGDDLYYIMKHEYTHICNRDSLVKLLALGFCFIFWWNPAAYMLRRDVEQILEIKCDVGATQGFEQDGTMDYLTTIVRLLRGRRAMKAMRPPLMALSMTCMTEDEEIRERFRMLAKASKPVGRQYQYLFLAAVFAAFLITYVFVLQTAYEPPEDEVYTHESVKEIISSDSYILQNEDGTYSYILGNGESFDDISEETLKLLLDDGLEIRKE